MSASSRAGKRRLDDPLANLRPGGGQGFDVIDVEGLETLFDAARQPALRQQIAERRGGGGEALRHPHAEMVELGDHLAQGGVLASYLTDVLHAQPVEGKNVGISGHRRLLHPVE